MEIFELISDGSRQLKNKNISTHRLDSEILLSTVLNKTREELLINSIVKNDIVICTALIPGKKAPRIISENMVKTSWQNF